MSTFARELESFEIPVEGVGLWWLSQAGFVIKSPENTRIVIDPYLSDAVERIHGMPRQIPALFDAVEIDFDAVLVTHTHEDHLDPDSISGLASGSRARFIAPPSAVQQVLDRGVPADRTVSVTRGDHIQIGDISITTVFARHMFDPAPTPDAVGFVIKVGGVSIYHSGDTEYDTRILDDTNGVDLSLICINGATGNMNAHEAALLAWQQKVGTAIPTHYDLWPPEGYGEGATLDPALFAETYHRLDDARRVEILEVGRPYTFGARGLLIHNSSDLN